MNRSLKAKILAERKRKRRWKAKSAGPTKGWSREYSQRAKLIDSGKYRLTSTDDMMMKLFDLDDVTEARQNETRKALGLSTSIKRSAREEVLEKLDALTEQAPIEHHITLDYRRSVKVFLFWTSEHYFLIKKFKSGAIYKSDYFADRDTAFKFWTDYPLLIKWHLFAQIDHPAN